MEKLDLSQEQKELIFARTSTYITKILRTFSAESTSEEALKDPSLEATAIISCLPSLVTSVIASVVQENKGILYALESVIQALEAAALQLSEQIEEERKAKKTNYSATPEDANSNTPELRPTQATDVTCCEEGCL